MSEEVDSNILPTHLMSSAGQLAAVPIFPSSSRVIFLNSGPRTGVTWMLKVNIQTDQTDSPYDEEITLAVNLTVQYCVAMFGRLFANVTV